MLPTFISPFLHISEFLKARPLKFDQLQLTSQKASFCSSGLITLESIMSYKMDHMLAHFVSDMVYFH